MSLPEATPAVLGVHRRDSLSSDLSRGRITRQQYLAGREFQRCYQLADKRRDADPEREQPGDLPDDQSAAWKWLAKAYRALGADGSALVNDVLINGMNAKDVADARGLSGRQWEKYLSRRLAECLNTLAEVFGFSRA